MTKLLVRKSIALMIISIVVLLLLTMQVSASETENFVDEPSLEVLEEAEVIQQEEEQPIAVVETSSDPRATIINSASLNPKNPKSSDLDEYVDSIMSDIITEEMTTYQQTKACYDYVIANTRYGSHMGKLSAPIGSTTAGSIYSQYGAVEGFGAVALSAKTGMCNAYASAFILMANEIGLDANLVKGYTKGSGGSYVYHEWAEVNVDGTVYVFDPQLDQDLTKYGLGEYNVFCKTYDQTNGRYSKA